MHHRAMKPVPPVTNTVSTDTSTNPRAQPIMARDHVSPRGQLRLNRIRRYVFAVSCGWGRVWKIGHPISVCHDDSSWVSEGPTR
jgi:hypothetical protein